MLPKIVGSNRQDGIEFFILKRKSLNIGLLNFYRAGLYQYTIFSDRQFDGIFRIIDTIDLELAVFFVKRRIVSPPPQPTSRIPPLTLLVFCKAHSTKPASIRFMILVITTPSRPWGFRHCSTSISVIVTPLPRSADFVFRHHS